MRQCNNRCACYVFFSLRDQRISRIARAKRSETLACLFRNVSRMISAFFPRRSSQAWSGAQATTVKIFWQKSASHPPGPFSDRATRSHWILETYFSVLFADRRFVSCATSCDFMKKKFMTVCVTFRCFNLLLVRGTCGALISRM